MYQERARDLLSPLTTVVSTSVEAAMWDLFLEIGKFWELTDDTAGYRLRLQAFMANRISLESKYVEYYRIAARVIPKLVTDKIARLSAEGLPEAEAQTKGRKEAYCELFTKDTGPRELQQVRKVVSREFILWRLAIGGFSAFGALNYPGYIGGANLPNQPAPYRTRELRP